MAHQPPTANRLFVCVANAFPCVFRPPFSFVFPPPFLVPSPPFPVCVSAACHCLNLAHRSRQLDLLAAGGGSGFVVVGRLQTGALSLNSPVNQPFHPAF